MLIFLPAGIESKRRGRKERVCMKYWTAFSVGRWSEGLCHQNQSV
jgi:hypothetical protein